MIAGKRITQSVLDSVDKLYDESGKITHYVFNDVEVWGGDCFVNLFDFSRMQPEHTDCAKNEGLKQAIEKVLKVKVVELPVDPQLMGALGAAEYARQKGRVKQ